MASLPGNLRESLHLKNFSSPNSKQQNEGDIISLDRKEERQAEPKGQANHAKSIRKISHRLIYRLICRHIYMLLIKGTDITSTTICCSSHCIFCYVQ